jgi:hypothetical protein
LFIQSRPSNFLNNLTMPRKLNPEADFHFSGIRNALHWIDEIPLQPEREEALDTTHATLIAAGMNGLDDPWYWSVDRVVKELCTPDRSWEPLDYLKELPASVNLESKLRDEGISGYVFLCDITDQFMKEDLGLTKLAWRSFVRTAVGSLRIRSVRYMEYALEHTVSHFPYQAASPAASLAALAAGLEQKPIQSNQIPLTPPAHTQQLPPVLNGFFATGYQNVLPSGRHLPPVPNNSAATEFHHDLQSDQGLVTSTDGRSARRELVGTDDLDNKRRKLDLTNAASNLALQTEDGFLHEAQQSEEAWPQAEDNITTPTPDPAKVNTKKRKRIAPTLITSEIDPTRNREIPTAADDVVQNDPQTIQPGVLFRSDDGRKRLVPIHQPEGDSDQPYDYQALLQKSRAAVAKGLDEGGDKALNAAQEILKNAGEKKSRQLSQSKLIGYLGKKKMGVDEIFYAGIPVGQDLPPSEDPQEFCVSPKNISGGRRNYMHRVTKRYLNSERTLLARDGKYFSAVRPYTATLAPKHHKPSFTLFYATKDGQVRARREELQSWPEIDPEAHQQKITDVDGNHVTIKTSAGILGAIGSHDPLDLDLLEKYNHIEGGDKVLPLYGESDEENEYDIVTWKEIEKEQGTLNKPSMQLKKSPLAIGEVHEAIDEGIAEIVVKWNKQKLPFKKHKAFKIWSKSGFHVYLAFWITWIGFDSKVA